MIKKQETCQIQGMAILAMLFLHLFDTLTPAQFTPLVNFTGVPLVYFFGHAADFCVMAYCFCSGYGLMSNYISCEGDTKKYFFGRLKGLFKFLLNFWLVLALYSLVVLIIGKGAEYLVSPIKFIGNFITFWYTYNGSWWYVSTYILMVLLSPLVFYAVQRFPKICAFAALAVYFVSYLIRFNKFGIDNFLLQHLSRLGMSYAELLIGVYFHKYKCMDKIEKVWDKFVPKKLTVVILIITGALVIVARRYVQTLFVAPVSGIIFIVAYLLAVRKYARIGKPFEFLGKHSLNMWLVHMFFYLPSYGGIAYMAKYPVLILLLLLALSLCASYIIKFIHNVLGKLCLLFKKKVIRT